MSRSARCSRLVILLICLVEAWVSPPVIAQDVKSTEVYARIRAAVDEIWVIDTHDHLRPVRYELRDEIAGGERVLTLRALLASTYLGWVQGPPAWPASQRFEDWWKLAEHAYDDVRATSFYRYLLPAFRDLYGVNFEAMTATDAANLHEAVIANYRDHKSWKRQVIHRAKIEKMLIDPHWSPLVFEDTYPEFEFVARVMRVDPLIECFTERYSDESVTHDAMAYAASKGIAVQTLDEYLNLAEHIFDQAQAAGVVGVKCGAAYRRALDFQKVSRDRAAKVYAMSKDQRSQEDIRDMENFMFYYVASACAQRNLPLQIHTGLARLPGSNPMLLADVIRDHPKTTFVLFHGGYPWIEETGALAFSFRNVWIDSNWLSNLSYSRAKVAYQQWLEICPSNRIVWGADNAMVEGIYGATQTTRRCLAEALAEKVLRQELQEADAVRIAQQILRDNALELYPSLKK